MDLQQKMERYAKIKRAVAKVNKRNQERRIEQRRKWEQIKGSLV